MAHSFVSTIYHHSRLTNREYFRGPDIGGFWRVHADSLVTRVMYALGTGDHRIFFVGYSRGGALLIDTARRLQARGVSIEGIFLFDAVDRTILQGTTASAIPSSVTHAYHAVRDASANSRRSFGNCGLRHEQHPDFRTQAFVTTHGGMGGVPWGSQGAWLGRAAPSNPNPVRKPVPVVVPAATAALATVLAAPLGLHLLGQRAGQTLTGTPLDTIDEGDFEKTSVDAATEANGMWRVQHWMWTHLKKHGVLP